MSFVLLCFDSWQENVFWIPKHEGVSNRAVYFGFIWLLSHPLTFRFCRKWKKRKKINIWFLMITCQIFPIPPGVYLGFFVDWEIAPRKPCTRYLFSWCFCTNSGPPPSAVCLFTVSYLWIKFAVAAGLLQMTPPLPVLQQNGCNQETSNAYKLQNEYSFSCPKNHRLLQGKLELTFLFLLCINNYCSYVERSLHIFWKWVAGKQQQELQPGNFIVEQWDIVQHKVCQIEGRRVEFSHQKEIFI